MGISAPAKVKYAIIYEVVHRDNNLLNISFLCEIAQVSRSGYYAWVAAEPRRKARDEQDKKDFELILKAFQFRGYAKGARSIHMRLLHQGVLMNVKKIRRLMNKYHLKCPFRKPNPYKKMARDMQTSYVADNIVHRDFLSRGPRKVLLTDITYLYYSGNKCYLSTILDAATHEILAYQLSISLKVGFVIKTVEKLVEKHGSVLDNDTIVHSDQGCHYTSHAFINKLKEKEFVQSMSRRGNCWDNSPQESFFGHMKDEIKDEIKKAETFHAVKIIIDDWIDYYNKDRYQWDLLKLSPVEYYEYLLTGKYPLQMYKNNQ